MTKSQKGEQNYQEQIEVQNDEIVRKLSGLEHETLRTIAKIFSIRLGARGNVISLVGLKRSVKQAAELIRHLSDLIMEGRDISLGDVRNAALRMSKELKSQPKDFLSDSLYKTKESREISPRGPGQRDYVEALKNHDIVFAVGPAGTGKTYLAMTIAVMELNAERISRIILTRPAVEAGEKLGFLPGNIEEKVSPYLRPLYDALFDLVGVERAEELVAHGIIEVAPLAFMRGRTLNDAFVILDEGQNTTPEQMKMALTRLGFGSKMVITGDITQVDLAAHQRSGLIAAIEILKGVSGVSICRLSEKDVVRHPLVQSIIKAYDAAQR
jgi:phosphate starvation-inducible PhoH-like protein